MTTVNPSCPPVPKLKDYIFNEKLGSGTYGDVYKVKKKHLPPTQPKLPKKRNCEKMAKFGDVSKTWLKGLVGAVQKCGDLNTRHKRKLVLLNMPLTI